MNDEAKPRLFLRYPRHNLSLPEAHTTIFFNNLLHLPVGAAVQYLPFFQPGVEHGPQAPSIKVCPIIIVSNSGADNSASRHDSLNLKGSAESGEEND